MSTNNAPAESNANLLEQGNYIILIAGLLAAGKTTFSAYLSRRLHTVCLNKDHIKEILSDTIGFSNRAENKRLSVATFGVLKYAAEKSMIAGKPIILESNFTAEEGRELSVLIEKYGYTSVTVMFDGDLRVLHKRFIDRLNTPDRHAAHRAQDLSSFEDFKDTAAALRGFFVPGTRINVDATDLAALDYDGIMSEILRALANVNRSRPWRALPSNPPARDIVP